MTDDFEDALREALGQVIPTPPETPHRAAGARSYNRRARRTKAVVAVSAVAVVAAAVVVVPSVLATSGAGPNVAGPGVTIPTPQPPFKVPPHGNAASCGHSGRANRVAPSPPNGVVPPGAVLAQMCPAGTRLSYWNPPAEPLITGLDDLAALINSLPKTSPKPCPLAIRPQYTLTFEYPGGRAFSVEGDTGGCDLLIAGSVLRTGATPLLQAYLEAVRHQRAQFAPPDQAPTQPGCLVAGQVSRLDSRLVDGGAPSLKSVTICSYITSLGMEVSPVASSPLSPGEVRQLNADIAANSTHRPPSSPAITECRSSRGGDTQTILITGVDAWGSTVQIAGNCNVFSYTDAHGRWYWTPSEPVAGWFAELWPRGKSSSLGRISGTLMAVGGPAGSGTRPLAGSITLSQSGDTVHLQVGQNGWFTRLVQPGRYRVVGPSPSYGDNTAPCYPPTRVVTVRAGHTTRLDVLCQER